MTMPNLLNDLNHRIYEQLLKLIHKNEKQVNAQDNDGYTALMYAVIYDDENQVQKLLKMGADVSIKNNVGKTVLEIAEVCGSNAIKDLLDAFNPALEKDISKFMQPRETVADKAESQAQPPYSNYGRMFKQQEPQEPQKPAAVENAAKPQPQLP